MYVYFHSSITAKVSTLYKEYVVLYVLKYHVLLHIRNTSYISVLRLHIIVCLFIAHSLSRAIQLLYYKKGNKKRCVCVCVA